MDYKVYSRPKLPRNKYGKIDDNTAVVGGNSFFSSTTTSSEGGENAGTTYEIGVFRGATSTIDGVKGLVPAPKSNADEPLEPLNDNVKFLKGNGGWADIPISRYTTENNNKDGINLNGNLNVSNNVNVADTLTAHNLEITGLAHFWNLVIDEVKSVGGQLIITPANMEVDMVVNSSFTPSSDTSNPFYSLFSGAGVTKVNTKKCYERRTDGTKSNVNQWAKGDFAICKTFNMAAGTATNVSNKYYYTPVVNVGTETIDGTDYNFIELISSWVINGTTYNIGSSISGIKIGDGAINVGEGDAIVQLGNYSNSDRQNALIISAYNPIDTGIEAPCIAQYMGINRFIDLSNFRFTWFAKNSNEVRGNLKLQNGTTVVSITDGISSTVSSLSGTVQSNTNSINSINGTVNTLSGTVQSNTNSINTMSTSISQKADRVDLTALVNGLESCGIHINGNSSYIDMVGSVNIKQSGHNNPDTLRIFDSNNVVRIILTPDDITSLQSLLGEATNVDIASGLSSTGAQNRLSPDNTIDNNYSWILGAISCNVNSSYSLGILNQTDKITIHNVNITGTTSQWDITRHNGGTIAYTNISFRRYRMSVQYSSNQSTWTNYYQSEYFTSGLYNTIQVAPPMNGYYWRIYIEASETLSISERCTRNSVPSGQGQFEGRFNSIVNVKYSTVLPIKTTIGKNGMLINNSGNRFIYAGSDEFRFQWGNEAIRFDNSGISFTNDNFITNSPLGTVRKIRTLTSSGTIYNTDDIVIADFSASGNITLSTSNIPVGKQVTIIGNTYTTVIAGSAASPQLIPKDYTTAFLLTETPPNIKPVYSDSFCPIKLPIVESYDTGRYYFRTRLSRTYVYTGSYWVEI